MFLPWEFSTLYLLQGLSVNPYLPASSVTLASRYSVDGLSMFSLYLGLVQPTPYPQGL